MKSTPIYLGGQSDGKENALRSLESVPQDTKKIQTRLAELGLYSGTIDGIWGKGSQASLKSFKKKQSLKNPDKWDKETQLLLFRGTHP
jgi:peptidoglycan hydrolase-like protein with peptidoglycan-binding domain